MIGIENNLYPPQIATWMPAFVHTQPCRIYFSLSVYNVASDIGNVQIVINDQNTNASMLNTKKYPTGIMITSLQEDATRTGNDRYYVTIVPKTDIEGEQFEINTFYKVQIRFTGANAQSPPTDGKIAGWLIDNQKFFSEWSRVCLIKGISQPTVYLRNFENVTDDNQIVQFTAFNINFVGRLRFEDEANEKETLKSYRFYIYNESNNELIFDSGDIYTNYYHDPNEINYVLTYLLEESINYRLNFSYTTYNEYTNSDYIKHFCVVEGNLEEFKARVTVTPNVDLGCMSVNVSSDRSVMMVNNLVIRRSSNESNFTLWEDIHFEVVANEPSEHLDYIWNDYTVKSGIFYKYAAQTVNTRGERSFAVMSEHAEMIVFDDMFLTRENMQVRLRYDPNISSFKRTISESLTETIGSKYPYFRRNGNVNYKQFPISGLITWFCDEEGMFINKDKIYKDYVKDYQYYNEDENIDEYQDYIYEREFREKVMDFLYENTVKLFRSTTEGNILVKLMDINFTPNQTLGRMLYSFSAMAYEIDECTIPNYEKYGILTVGQYSTTLEHEYDKIGQWSGIVQKDQNLFQLTQDKYDDMVDENLINTLLYFRALKIEFMSDPYLIENAGGVLKPWTKTSDATESSTRAEDLIYGYIVYINGNAIVVSPRGFYELADDGTKVTSITFPLDTDVDFNYVARLKESENSQKIAASRYYYNMIAGQEFGKFDVDESIVGNMYFKYKTERKDFYTKLISVDSLAIESAPGVVVYIKDAFDTDYYRHVIGPTGVLKFYNDDTVITNAYVYGMHLVDHVGDRNEVRDEEYIYTNITANSFDEVEDPVKNGVYTILNATNTIFTEQQVALIRRPIETINDKFLTMMQANLKNDTNQYIYYHSHWYVFTDNHDVLCPVDMIADYICETVKGEY